MASIEVVNAVQQTLEEQGILQSIRAQLRASVINALKSPGQDHVPSKAVDFTSNETGNSTSFYALLVYPYFYSKSCYLYGINKGKIVAFCVVDLLKRLDMRQTLTVFEAEIGMVCLMSLFI
jgi:hypothetical protein